MQASDSLDYRIWLIALLGVSMLTLAGCGGPSSGSGQVIGTVEDLEDNTNPDGTVDEDIVTDGKIVLPSDTLLNLYCADVGIAADTCVLEDPENPYRETATREFDPNNPDADTKFELANALPAGPTGAKARFYLWATAQARFPRGENQYYTALALHELFTAAGDPIIQAQALKAYRSVLDNFFGSVTFFECCADQDPDNQPVPFSGRLNKLTADNLYRTSATNYARLIPGGPILTLAVISDWGYTYGPCEPVAGDENCNEAFVTVSEFP